LDYLADEKYMRRCLELAGKGFPFVIPNPMVGCVIVHQDTIIGEGFHRSYGMAHAERNAIESVKEPSLLPFSTLYVNLEPCSHHGKTPPCADLIVENKFHRVVIGSKDPNPLVRGNGIKKLHQAGITVDLNVLKKESIALNKRFFTFHQQRRPYVILKWAQTSDGFIADNNYNSKWISNEYARIMVHKWRTEEQAILVGTNTARIDNPQLTARNWEGKNPLRLVIDNQLTLDNNLALFDQSCETIVFNHLKTGNEGLIEFVKIKPEKEIFPQILNFLYRQNIQSLIVEGGATLLNSIIQEELWDEARIFIGNKSFGAGLKAPLLNICADEIVQVSDNKLRIFYNKRIREDI